LSNTEYYQHFVIETGPDDEAQRLAHFLILYMPHMSQPELNTFIKDPHQSAVNIFVENAMSAFGGKADIVSRGC